MPQNILIECGLHNRNTPETWVVERRVERIFQHPGYNSSTISNDISLLKFTEKLTKYTKQVAPVCLAQNENMDKYTDGSRTAVASGYSFRTKKNPIPIY